MNRVTLMGNVGNDPEYKQIGDKEVVKFTLATSESYKNAAGERVTNTTWHNITCWGGLAKFASQYVFKGSKYLIEGKIDNGKYEKDGVTHYTTQIVASGIEFCESRKDGNQSQPAKEPDPYTEPNDDLPF